MYFFWPLIQLAWLISLAFMLVIGLWILLSSVGIGLDPVRRAARQARRDASPAVCGSCGHAVGTAAASERCGECGTPYMQGGVVTTATAIRLGPPLWLGIATLCLAALALGSLSVSAGVRIGTALSMGGSNVYRIYGQQEYSPQVSTWRGGPDYQFYIDFDITGPDRWNSQGVEPGVAPRQGTLTLGVRGPDAQPNSVVYDIESKAWSIPARGGIAGASGSDAASAVREVYRRGGLDNKWSESPHELADAILVASIMAGEGAHPQGVQSLATEIMNDSQGLEPGMSSQGSLNLGSAFYGQPSVILPIAVSAALPLVILGLAIWLMVRLRRRGLRPVAADHV